MKYCTLVIFTLCIFCCSATAQKKRSEGFKIVKDSVVNNYLVAHLDSMGLDDSPFLNTYEVEYFNHKMKKERKKFDFSGKRIAFFEWEKLANKKKYFDSEKWKRDNILKSNYEETKSNFVYLTILNDKKKERTGGYDVLIVYYTYAPKMIHTTNHYIKALEKRKPK